MQFLDLLRTLRSKTWLIVAILVVDAVAMGYGWYYYWQVGQFNPDSVFYIHWAWWPLVADSPNAVLLFFVALLAGRFFGWRNRWLDWAAFVLNVYVGLWTSTLFLLYADVMGTWTWGSTNNILFFAHFGMPLQALLLLPDMRRDHWPWQGLLAGGLVLAAYIFVDYGWPGFHPAPFLHPNDAALHIASPILMAVAAGTFVVAVTAGRAWRRSSPP